MMNSARQNGSLSLGLGLEGTHVLVTGGSGMIGSVVVEAFLAAGCLVTSIDVRAPANLSSLDAFRFKYLLANITNEEEFEAAWQIAVRSSGPIQTCIALASLDLSVLRHHESLADMDLAQWRHTLDVNVGGTFLTARTWLRGLRELERDAVPKQNLALIMVGSESGHFGERSNADYAAAKSAVQVGLLQSLRADAPRVHPNARVNAIAPGPVATPKFFQECRETPEQYYADAQGTVALKRPVTIDRVARSIVYLASDAWSGDVHGQVLNVDCGKQGKIMWSKEECAAT
jgi:NAD(P)-dependent dehydrogenase (short-subunit alcohol dehydrogenase family)